SRATRLTIGSSFVWQVTSTPPMFSRILLISLTISRVSDCGDSEGTCTKRAHISSKISLFFSTLFTKIFLLSPSNFVYHPHSSFLSINKTLYAHLYDFQSPRTKYLSLDLSR